MADLPRIITLHDFTLEVSKDKPKEKAFAESLDLEILAKTYRYLTTAEESVDNNSKKLNQKNIKSTTPPQAKNDDTEMDLNIEHEVGENNG